MDEKIEAIVTHQFLFPGERVIESWIYPDLLRNWMRSALVAIGLPGELVVIEIDARVGGKFCFSDKRPMGEAFHWGTYTRLDRSTCIAFTWNADLRRGAVDDDSSLVTITFTPNETGCDVQLVHTMDAQWKDYQEQTEKGWKNMLVHIEKLLEHASQSSPT